MNTFKKIILGIWTFPNSFLGLLFIFLAVKGSVHIVDGSVEIESPLIANVFQKITNSEGSLLALTLGQFVIGCNKTVLRSARKHERVHVRQYERWGILFIPAFFIASFYAKLGGRHPYKDNIFEREAVDHAH
jgi:hypothetical protein